MYEYFANGGSVEIQSSNLAVELLGTNNYSTCSGLSRNLLRSDLHLSAWDSCKEKFITLGAIITIARVVECWVRLPFSVPSA